MLLARSLRSAAAALRSAPLRPLSSASPRALLPAPAAAPGLARSLWQLGGGAGRTALLRPRRGSAGRVSCGCGGLHTEGERGRSRAALGRARGGHVRCTPPLHHGEHVGRGAFPYSLHFPYSPLFP